MYIFWLWGEQLAYLCPPSTQFNFPENQSGNEACLLELQRQSFGWTSQRLAEVWWRRSEMLVGSSSVMAEAYGFGLPGNRKPLVIKNYIILNPRNVTTGRIATLGTWNVLLLCDYTLERIGTFNRSLCTDLCDADMRPTQPWCNTTH